MQITLDGDERRIPVQAGDTILACLLRAGVPFPFSCQTGNCGTCMARLTEGKATMRVNDALEDDEIEDGYVLTCQAVPDTSSVTVEYD